MAEGMRTNFILFSVNFVTFPTVVIVTWQKEHFLSVWNSTFKYRRYWLSN